MFYVYVLKRPGIEDFLQCVSRYYEIVIYTASLSKYAEPLISLIDPHQYAAHRLFREHCSCYNNTFVKDLTLLGRNLKSVIIVDNSPGSYAFQPENALPIQTWTDDPTDKSLYELIPILESLATMSDVRRGLSKIVQNGQIDYVTALKTLKGRKSEPKPPLINSWTGNPQPQRNTPAMQMKKSESTNRISTSKDVAAVPTYCSTQYKSRSSTPSIPAPAPAEQHTSQRPVYSNLRHHSSTIDYTSEAKVSTTLGVNSPKGGRNVASGLQTESAYSASSKRGPIIAKPEKAMHATESLAAKLAVKLVKEEKIVVKDSNGGNFFARTTSSTPKPTTTKIAIPEPTPLNHQQQLFTSTNHRPKTSHEKAETQPRTATPDKAVKEDPKTTLQRARNSTGISERKSLEQTAQIVKIRSEKLAKLYSNLLSRNKEAVERKMGENSRAQVELKVEAKSSKPSGVNKRSSCDMGATESLLRELGCNSTKHAEIVHVSERDKNFGTPSNGRNSTTRNIFTAGTPKNKRAYSVKKEYPSQHKENTMRPSLITNPFLDHSRPLLSTLGQCSSPKQFWRVNTPTAIRGKDVGGRNTTGAVVVRCSGKIH